ncbi:hypothetical protein BJX62DRAFT_244788 [Aspergillus germanicus]
MKLTTLLTILDPTHAIGAKPQAAYFYSCYDCNCEPFQTLDSDHNNFKYVDLKSGAASVGVSRYGIYSNGECRVYGADVSNFDDAKCATFNTWKCWNSVDRIGWVWHAYCRWQA